MKKYVVIRNSKSKILDTWKEAKENITKDSIYKSFATLQEAKSYAFIPKMFPEENFIYIDGSMLKTKPVTTGWAAAFIEKEKSSVYSDCSKKGTSNTAELNALLVAIEKVASESKKWYIMTDSKYVMYLYHQVKSDILLSKIPKEERQIKLYHQMTKNVLDRIILTKVKAHSGVHWNEIVDKEAKKAAMDCKNK